MTTKDSMNQDNRVLSANLSAAVRMGDDEAIRFVDWVRGAAPYFHAFRGKTFVLAFGGKAIMGPLAWRGTSACAAGV